MEMNLGNRGVTRQSWSRDAARVAFMEIKSEHPKANHDKLVRLLSERATEDPDLLTALADCFVTNAETSLRGYGRITKDLPIAQPTPPSRSPRFESYEKYQEHKEKLDKTATQIANQILLLNMEMPNGKRMRYCTGVEMLKFGKGYSRIGKKVGNKMVGQVLDEAGVRKFMG